MSRSSGLVSCLSAATSQRNLSMKRGPSKRRQKYVLVCEGSVTSFETLQFFDADLTFFAIDFIHGASAGDSSFHGLSYAYILQELAR